jgi:hypothetical protein
VPEDRNESIERDWDIERSELNKYLSTFIDGIRTYLALLIMKSTAAVTSASESAALPPLAGIAPLPLSADVCKAAAPVERRGAQAALSSSAGGAAGVANDAAGLVNVLAAGGIGLSGYQQWTGYNDAAQEIIFHMLSLKWTSNANRLCCTAAKSSSNKCAIDQWLRLNNKKFLR